MNSAAHVLDYKMIGDFYSTDEMRSIFNETSTLHTWLQIEAALAETQAELGIIPSWAAVEIHRVASEANFDFEKIGKENIQSAHILIAVLRELETLAGSAGKYIHHGATTQDILDTALILQLKQVYTIVKRDLLTIIARLTDLAHEHRDTVMVGRTHGIHAAPTTMGFKFSVWIVELMRQGERFEQSAARVLVGQLGGSVGTMAGFGPEAFELRKRLCKKLYLNHPIIAWQASRDIVIEFVLLASFLGGTLGKIANEIAFLQTTEIGEVEEPASEEKVGSSTMPQKQNPVFAETVVAIARLLEGSTSSALGTLRTRGERDWTTWGAEIFLIPEAACLLAGQLKHIKHILNGIQICEQRMRLNAERFLNVHVSEGLMLRLSVLLGRSSAHELVSFLTRQALEENKDFRELVLSDPKVLQILNEQEIRAVLDLNANLSEAKAEVNRVVQQARRFLIEKSTDDQESRGNSVLVGVST
jgi:adenylosuccinate lyase